MKKNVDDNDQVIFSEIFPCFKIYYGGKKYYIKLLQV